MYFEPLFKISNLLRIFQHLNHGSPELHLRIVLSRLKSKTHKGKLKYWSNLRSCHKKIESLLGIPNLLTFEFVRENRSKIIFNELPSLRILTIINLMRSGKSKFGFCRIWISIFTCWTLHLGKAAHFRKNQEIRFQSRVMNHDFGIDRLFSAENKAQLILFSRRSFS